MSGIKAARTLLNRPDIRLYPQENDNYAPVWHVMRGTVAHNRPNKHGFSVPLSMDYFSLSSTPNFWFRRYRRGDYFGDRDQPLDHCVREVVREQLGVYPSGAIDLITHMSGWGFCFNPISFYICWCDGERTKVDFLCIEVTNIPWSQRTVFAIDVRNNASGRHVRLKPLHVSPFNPPPDGEQQWHIEYDTTKLPQQFKCVVSTKLETETLTRANMTLQQDDNCTWQWYVPQSMIVVFFIHLHALFLWLKGVAVHTNTTNVDWKRV